MSSFHTHIKANPINFSLFVKEKRKEKRKALLEILCGVLRKIISIVIITKYRIYSILGKQLSSIFQQVEANRVLNYRLAIKSTNEHNENKEYDKMNTN